jgi:amidohydrolase
MTCYCVPEAGFVLQRADMRAGNNLESRARYALGDLGHVAASRRGHAAIGRPAKGSQAASLFWEVDNQYGPGFRCFLRGDAMSARDELKARVIAEIDRNAERITALSDEIMRHPETGFREHETARRIAEQFRAMGVPFREGLAGTGVKARLSGRSGGPAVAVLGELDSLIISDHPHADPGTGAAHACGHNAQLASMIGAGLGLQAVLDELDGDVVLFAVPAEECIELDWRLAARERGDLEFVLGKAELIRLGEFDDIDLALITHTAGGSDGPLAISDGTTNGSLIKRVRFRGRAAHAGSAPWHGVNAYQALSVAIHALDAQRETFDDADCVRINHLITKAGEAVSAIPADARLEMMIRARTIKAMDDASRKVDRALRAGAIALGAEVDILTVAAYLPMICDRPLVDLVDGNARALLGDDRVERHRGHRGGSTDVGDLGQIMPVAHPNAASGHDGPAHSSTYFVRDHYLAAVNPAKFMATTVVDLLYDGASEASRVIRDSGPKLTRDEYLALRRSLDNTATFKG